ncbi:hypothetical protein [Arcanobacterium hippocoleae]|uniref:hypothetical protein n=1 Tax=Arcanobacterium hippocoleae TaxID=149017 RepID=UPI00333E8E31
MKDISIKRIAGIGLSICGVLLALFALIFGALRNAPQTVQVQVPSAKTTFVYTDSGVLSLFPQSSVRIQAAAPKNGELLWAIGRSEDVRAYVGESSYTRIAGIQSAEKAKTTLHNAKSELRVADEKFLKDGAQNFVDSDIWEKSGRQKDDLELQYEVPKGTQRAVLVTATNGVAPEVTLTWKIKAATFPTIQITILGILLALIGIYLLFTDTQSRARVNYFRKREVERKAQRLADESAATQVLPLYQGDLAAPQTTREVQHKHTDGAFGAAILPGTSRTLALRESELDESDRIIFPQNNLGEDPAQEAEAERYAQAAAQLRLQNVSLTEGALGAAILPGTVRYREIRQRPLAPENRVVLPIFAADAEPELDAENAQDQDPVTETQVAEVAAEDDWKQLWHDADAVDSQREAVEDASHDVLNPAGENTEDGENHA